MKRLTILFFCLLFGFSYAQEQDSARTLEKSVWQNETQGVSYIQEREKPKEYTPRKSRDWNFSELEDVMTVVAYILLITIIVYVIWLVLPEEFKRKNLRIKSRRKISFDDLDEDIHEADLEKALKYALKKNKYREAVRVYYLIALRNLDDIHKIDWHKEKTNQQYIFELFEDPWFDEFKELTFIYEYFWYGEYKMDKDKFSRTQPLFTSFIEKSIPKEA